MSLLSACFRSVYVLLLLAVSACSVHGTPDSKPIVSEFRLASGVPILPLMVNVEAGREIYQGAMFGIDIVEVLADGENVAGSETLRTIISLNPTKHVVEGNHFIYKVAYDRMIFVRLTADGAFSGLVEYSVPDDVETLQITYRLVEFGGSPGSQIYRLKAFRA